MIKYLLDASFLLHFLPCLLRKSQIQTERAFRENIRSALMVFQVTKDDIAVEQVKAPSFHEEGAP